MTQKIEKFRPGTVITVVAPSITEPKKYFTFVIISLKKKNKAFNYRNDPLYNIFLYEDKDCWRWVWHNDISSRPFKIVGQESKKEIEAKKILFEAKE